MNAARQDRPGAVFWTGVAAGWLMIAWGVWLVVARAPETRPVNFAAFFVGLALVHDLVLAPVVMAAGAALRRRAPALAAGAIAAGLVVSSIVVVYAIPLWLDRATKTAQNPSFLSRDPAVGVVTVLTLTWIVVGAVVLGRLLGSRPR